MFIEEDIIDVLNFNFFGITKFLNGEYNKSNPQVSYYDWIPRYIAFGTNISAYDSGTSVTDTVDVNDTKLLNEIGTRIALPERNIIINKNTQSYVQLVITSYVPETQYNGQTLREAGLFSKATGNNCLFRIVFDDINKTDDLVLEVNWTISVISIESGNQPYQDADKVDLWNSLELLLTRFGQVCPDISTFCADTLNAIIEYAKTNSTPESIRVQTQILNTDYNAMNGWDVIGISDEILQQVDDINGEVIE